MGKGDVTDFGWGGAAGSYLIIDQKNEITVFYAQHVLNSPVQDLKKQLFHTLTATLKTKKSKSYQLNA